MVIKNGMDVDMRNLCGCPDAKTLNQCEKCPRYYSCDAVAAANDELVEYENQRK